MKAELTKRLRTATPAQDHVLAFWDELNEARQTKLAEQIAALDLELISGEVAAHSAHASDSDTNQQWAQLAARAQSPPAFRLDGSGARFTADDARRRGEAALRDGRFGMILVAGGQGTRLGFDHPKGMYPLGPISKRSIFQMLVELLIAIDRRYETHIPLYLMTSPATHDETLEFFDKHNRFGLPRHDLHVFCQGTLPALDAQTGRILLADKDELSLAPDGHGGMLAAFCRSGCLDLARRRGIEHLFYGQVDNPLIQICDPQLIGYHLLCQSEMTTQAVMKAEPLERVGNVVSVDGHVQIIEYSDLPEDAALRRDADGTLALWAGNIAVHVFSLEFLGRVADQADALPFHQAIKQVPYLDIETGRIVEPDMPNALKLERFIFDLLPHARNAVVVEADRARAFAPVKNSNDKEVDTPDTAQAALIALHTEMLQQAGATIEDGVPVEISPLFALDANELRDKIPSGLHVAKPRYFGPGDEDDGVME